MRLLGLLVGWLALFSNCVAMQVSFINPGKSDEAFWVSVSQTMQAAADELGVGLEIHYAQRNHIQMLNLLDQILQRSQKPDYLILVNEKGMGAALLARANAARVPSLLLLNTLSPHERQHVGFPRQRLPYWLGSLTPDNEMIGYLTAKQLLHRAQAQTKPVQLLAINGDRMTPAALAREQGLSRALREFPQAKLMQTVYADWERPRAAQQSTELLQRYPAVYTIWAASDQMAFGALQASRALQRPLIVSGVNTSFEALRAVQTGELAVLGGGHFVAGGFAIVMLYDYHHGLDFAKPTPDIEAPLMTLIQPPLAIRLYRQLSQPHAVWGFKRFSKLGKNVAPPAFSLTALLTDP